MTGLAGVEGLKFPFRNKANDEKRGNYCPFHRLKNPKDCPTERQPEMQNYPHLMRDRDRHGNERLYFRRRGRKVRLRHTPGSSEFEAELAAARERLHQPAILKPRKYTGSYVYFLLFGSNARVKIGTSRNPRARIAGLSTGAPGKVRLYYVTPGDRGLEADLHQRFAEYRINGEWFIYAQPIREWIKADEARRIEEARS